MKITKEGIAVIEGDTHISKWVEESGRLDHDQSFVPMIVDLIPENGVVLDVGAFIGDHTVAYRRKVGSKGHVFAFEPNPIAFDCLSYNCPNCCCYNYGLSDTDTDDAVLNIGPNAGECHVDCSVPKNGKVKMRRLDTLPTSFHRIDLIKIDVEGFEVKVLAGGVNTIMSFRPVLVIEVVRRNLIRAGVSAEHLFGALEVLRYSYKPAFKDHSLKDEQYDLICKPL